MFTKKIDIHFRFYSVFHFFCLALVSLAIAGILSSPAWGNKAAFTIVKSDAESIDLHVSVPPVTFDKVVVAGKTWTRLSIPEYHTTVKPGVPQFLSSRPWSAYLGDER